MHVQSPKFQIAFPTHTHPGTADEYIHAGDLRYTERAAESFQYMLDDSGKRTRFSSAGIACHCTEEEEEEADDVDYTLTRYDTPGTSFKVCSSSERIIASRSPILEHKVHNSL